MNIDQEFAKLKQDIDVVKTKKIQVATKLKALEEEKDLLLQECESLGLDPQKIEEKIKELETSLQTEVLTIQQQLNLLK